jgi:putative SOS response-associated peptidase YedK
MCGRYVVKTPIKTIAKMHCVFDAPLFEPRYNVAPTQSVPIVRAKDAGRELALVRWGLIPAWAKDAKIGYRLINARVNIDFPRSAEGVYYVPADLPTF